MLALMLGLSVVLARDDRETACYMFTSHLGKQPDYDIRKMITKKEEVMNKIKLMNYVLYDIFEHCMEGITNSQIKDVLEHNEHKILPESFGLYPGKYKASEIPNVPSDFFTDLLKFQTEERGL